jgi:tetratricopeptide (TPR) repeat protein
VRIEIFTVVLAASLAPSPAMGQPTVTPGSQTVPGPATVTPNSYVPGTTFEAINPNYMSRNPFYFEGRVDWNLPKITTPSNPWEFVQRGIHYQDDLEDTPNAIADFQTALSQNSLSNGTCQILTVAVVNSPNLNPAPCMFTPRLRLGHLIKANQPTVAIDLFQQVLQIDPLRLGVNAYIGDVYVAMAQSAADRPSMVSFYNQAIAAYKAELLLSPVTPATTALSGDKANNEHVHWSLSEVYAALDDTANQAIELQAYLDASQWHSDTYAWHIQLAKARLAKLQARRRPIR